MTTTAEAVVHPVLASTTVVEQSHDLTQQVRDFYDRNHTVISVAGVLALSLFLTRSIVRRELTRLKFIVEVVSEPDYMNLEGYNDLD
jgi:hypothetical protein